jgi:hypothetical protein
LSAQDLLIKDLARVLFEKTRASMIEQGVKRPLTWRHLHPLVRQAWFATATYVEQFARATSIIASYHPSVN